MKDKQQQIYNTLIYLLPMVLTSILPLVTLSIFTRILTPEDYGNLGLAMIYAIFSGGLANFGMSLVFDRNYFQYRESKDKLGQLLFTSLTFVCFNFLALIGVTFIFKDKISIFLIGSDQHGILIIIAFSAFFFLSVSNNFFFIFLKNSEKASIHSKYKIIESVLIIIISILFVAYFRIGVIGIVLGQLITGVLLFCIFLHITLKELPFHISKSILIESLKISYPLTPRIFIGVINTQFDKYMIGMMATISGVGIYHIGKRISEIIFTFMTVLQNVYHPQIYMRMFGKHEKGSESIGKYLTPFLYISIIIALNIALFSEEILTLLTPKNYHGAVPIVSILAMYYGSMFFGKIPQLMYAKKTYILSILFVTSTSLNIVFNIPFIMKFGAIGAAWATLLAGLISGTISLLIAQHYYKILYEWEKVFWIMGIFFCGASIITVMYLLDAPYHWAILIKSSVMVIYITLGVRYGVISKKNFKEVKSIFRLTKVTAT